MPLRIPKALSMEIRVLHMGQRSVQIVTAGIPGDSLGVELISSRPSTPRSQRVLTAAEYRGLETVAEIGRNDSDQVCAPAPKRTSEIVGAISKLFRGFHDPLPSSLGETGRFGDIIENHRDRRSRQTEVLGQLFQCDWVARMGPR